MLRPELTKDPPSPIPVASYKKPRENKPRKIPQANQPSKHMMVQVDIDLNESTPATGSSLQQIESPKGQLDFSLHTDSSVRRSADAVYGPGSSLDRVITHPDNEKRTPISGTICVFPSHANTPRPAMGRPSSGTSPAGSLNGSQLSLPTQNPSMRSHNGSLPIPHHYPSHPAYSVVSGANNSPSLNAAASPYTYNILSNSNDSEDLHVVDQPNIGMRTLSIDTVRSPSDKGIGTSHILPGPPISPLPGLNMELPFPDVPLIPVHDEESFIGIEQPVMDATTTTTSSPFLHSGTSSITTLPSPLLNEPLSPFPASLSPYWTSGFTPAEVPSYLPDEYLNGSPYNPSTSVTGPGGQSGLISHGDSPYLRHNGVFSDNPSPYQTHSLMLYDSQPPESPSIDTYTSFPNFPDPSISQRRSYPMSPQSRSPYQSPGIILQHFGSIMSRMEPVAPNSTVDAYSHGTPSFHSDLAGASGSYTSSFDGQTTSQSSHLTLPDTQLTDHDARRNGYTQSRNGNALDPQNDSFTTTTDSDETPLVTTENRKSSNRDPWSSSALPHSSINRSALFSRVRDLNSYENFAINLDNEPITTAGRDFCSYSSIPDDLKLFYPQSNQKVLHRTSLLSPVQVTSVPRPTMYSVEGSGEDVPQSCSRLACLPKAGDQSSSLASTSNAEAPEDMFVKLPYSYQNRPSSGSPSQLIKPNSNPKTTPIIKTPGSVNGSPGIDLVIAAGVRVLLRDHRLAIGQKGKTVKSGSTPYQLSIGITTSEDREMETEINGKGQDALRLGSHVTKEKLEQPEESNRVRWCRVGPVGGVSKRKWSKILVILPPVYSKKRPPDTWVASGNRNDPQNDRFMTTPDPSDSPLIMTKIESSNKQPVLLSSSYFLPRSSSAINKPRRATFVPMVSSESETSLSPPICVPQTVSGSSTLLNTGYEDLVTDSDNETVTLPGTCIQANFLSDSDSDPESPYPQSSQKVPHHTSLLSPVQVAFIPGPTVGVEGDDKDVTQSRSRWGRIPKANNQGTPELSHPSEDDHDGASPEVEFTRLDTLQLSVTGSNVASVPDKNLVTISGEISEIVSAGNPNINASNEAIRCVLILIPDPFIC
ncbi:hypothetical protein K435DRAFT_317864 [Dendrothele bispora CBS 962.96]|uniref:Uncharacterized protein n=1 Tax=Dendrothele bispora (strain CBS 962.96) TaxID=1314807 RepID=A0A4S8LGX1_DENBC|nr:hypothetical protein K435DRAFT_317864 [Dendrothele bispora CBS 962.96]